MMSRIVSLDPQAPRSFAPLLAGASPSIGAPLLLGYELCGTACGVLAADCFDDAVTLRWICVDGCCQHHGIAGELLDTLCTLAGESGARQIDAVACLDNKMPLEVLLTHRGFTKTEESSVYSFPLSAVLEGPLAHQAARKNPRLVPLHSLPGYLLRDFNHHISDPGGPLYPGINPDVLLPESMAWLENGAVTGCVLLAPCGEDVELRWLYAKDPAAVQGLMAGAVGAVAASHTPQTVIHVTALTASVDTLVRKLAGNQLTTHAPVVRYSLQLKGE